MKKTKKTETLWLLGCVIFAVACFIFFGYINFTQPYDAKPANEVPLYIYMVWGLLYLPALVLPLAAHWKVVDFGFAFSPFALLAVVLAAIICNPISQSLQITLHSAMTEAFARTGEELFYRGFIYLLVLKILQDRPRNWLYAMLISSLAFSVIHLQILQLALARNLSMAQVVLATFEGMLNVFELALLFGFFRHWTKSILPSAAMHCLLKGGILTLPFCLLIFSGFTLWAKLRGEQVVSGFSNETIKT